MPKEHQQIFSLKALRRVQDFCWWVRVVLGIKPHKTLPPGTPIRFKIITSNVSEDHLSKVRLSGSHLKIKLYKTPKKRNPTI